MISLNELCQGIIKKWSEKERLKEGLALYYWPQIIGNKLAYKSKAERVTNGILWIKTNDPSLAQNLTFFKRQIIYKYNRVLGFGIIRSVRIVTGDIGIEKKSEEKSKEEYINEKYKEMVPENIDVINDQKLKDAFSRFYRYHSFLKQRRLTNGFKECDNCGRLYEESDICICKKKLT